MRSRASVIFCSLASSTVLGFLFACALGALVPNTNPPKRVSIFELMDERAWLRYKEHINSCEVCSSLDEESRYKMCPRSFYLSDPARPMITNDQLRLMAQGKLVITEY